MPSEDNVSDDYVATLLKKDAKESSIRYSAMGLQALLPKRPTTNAPKPNVRFLKNIIRDTDNHNAALKAKETEESRARLRRLRDQELGEMVGRRGMVHGKHRRHDEDRNRGDRRRLDDHRVDLEEGRLSRYEDSPPSGTRRTHHEDEETNRATDESKHRSTRHDDRRHRARRHRDEHSEKEDDSDGARHQRRHHHRRHRHRDRSRSRSPDIREPRKEHRSSRRRSRSPQRERNEHRKSHHRRSRSSSPSSAAEASTRRRHKKPTRPTSPPAATLQATQEDAMDSDPLEALIGPPPPPPAPKVRARGRGTFASSSAMDAHFSSGYDPTADVRPNSESEDDWEQALEALRDRQRWNQQGADRLRAAGFTEEEVKKWEKGGEKKEEDVRWKRSGEGREWDRGKVVGANGAVDTRAAWGTME